MNNFNKKELIKTLILLAIIIVISAFCIHLLTSGETLSEYRDSITNSTING